jgi:F0F1-type ATP synthase alpha subunit
MNLNDLPDSLGNLKGGGSLTALPIIEQVTFLHIPTNVISIPMVSTWMGLGFVDVGISVCLGAPCLIMKYLKN